MSDIPEGCIPFDLEKALDGWPVRTGDGREIEFLKRRPNFSQNTCVLAVFASGDCVGYTINGEFNNHGAPRKKNRLFLVAPPQQTTERWVGLYLLDGIKSVGLFETEEEAEQEADQIAKKRGGELLTPSLVSITVPSPNWPGDGFGEWWEREGKTLCYGDGTHKEDANKHYQAGRQSVRRKDSEK